MRRISFRDGNSVPDLARPGPTWCDQARLGATRQRKRAPVTCIPMAGVRRTRSKGARQMAFLRRGGRRDQDAEFVEFYEARAAMLRKTAFVLCGDWHLAEDLTQTTFTKLYLAWQRLDRHDQLDRYARQVLVRAFLDEGRRPWRREYSTTPESPLLDHVVDTRHSDERDAAVPRRSRRSRSGGARCSCFATGRTCPSIRSPRSWSARPAQCAARPPAVWTTSAPRSATRCMTCPGAESDDERPGPVRRGRRRSRAAAAEQRGRPQVGSAYGPAPRTPAGPAGCGDPSGGRRRGDDAGAADRPGGDTTATGSAVGQHRGERAGRRTVGTQRHLGTRSRRVGRRDPGGRRAGRLRGGAGHAHRDRERPRPGQLRLGGRRGQGPLSRAQPRTRNQSPQASDC